MKNGPYELVLAPLNFPGKKYRGRYVYEHHLVWWIETEQLVPEGFLLHHKNEDKRDNRKDNLELKSRGVHSAEHSRGRSRKQPDIEVRCFWCSVVFMHNGRNHKFKIKMGQVRFFCCKSHQVKQQQKDRRHK